jgi:SAM-dependent methyltransferase
MGVADAAVLFAVRTEGSERSSQGCAMNTVRNCSWALNTNRCSNPLDSQGIDFVTAAQAFHWSNVERAEFLRVLKPDGEVAIIWNDRVEGDALRAAVDQLLDQYGGTKRAVLHAHEDRSYFYRFFGKSRPQTCSFASEQWRDEKGFTGLLFSGSYVPLRTSGEGRRLEIELRSLFRRFERNENVAARYRTVALIGRPSCSRSKQTTAVRQIPD